MELRNHASPSLSRASLSRHVGRGVVVAGVVGFLGVVGAGCLSRPVSTQPPTTKTNFTAQVRQAAVDKIDMLFMIDNSQSMGDKQEILNAAVPDLITRLVQPNCVDVNDTVLSQCVPGAGGTCTCATGKIEFPPVHDMHIGIVSSSLGGRGSDECPEPEASPVGGVDGHDNDFGELINRSDPGGTGSEANVPDASGAGDNFLAWFPSAVAANMGQPAPPVTAIQAVATLKTDFTDLVSGVHQFGCGFEAQDEAWYRFLVQPDPYDHVSRAVADCQGNGNTACLVGIDKTILQQRHDFLRPDSLVAVIMVTDENSGEVTDPLALGGQGWAYMQSQGTASSPGFPGSGTGFAAMGTSACGPTPVMGPNPGPISSGCTSCGFSGNGGDPNCKMNGGYYADSTSDNINTRGVYDKQRFGVDPRFPVQRYITGLTASKVPDSKHEHTNGSYVSTPNCTNPLFATNLPTNPTGELCNLAHGPRTPDLVFLAAITGVPHELLQAKIGVDPECSGANMPTSGQQADCPQKGTFVASDWQAMLGKDPENYDFTGISPTMFVSINPRTNPGNLPVPGGGVQPPSASSNGTAWNGREWNTGGADQQYACIFPLATPRECASGQEACDCDPGKCDMCGSDPNCTCPPLCNIAGGMPTQQIMAKAYPSPREVEEVKGMADQGILSSLCPIHVTDNATMDDPLFGYRPAVAAIIDRLKNALANQCLPQQLTPGSCGNVPCLILETIPKGTCQASEGLTAPDPDVLAKFQQSQHDAWAAGGGADAGLGPDPVTLTTCEVTQLVNNGGKFDPSCSSGSAPAANHYQYAPFDTTGSCANVAAGGWCYVSGAAAGGSCPQSILFSTSGNPQSGAQVFLECIEQAGTLFADGG